MAAQKLDPYINVDPGTMSPYQHGEVFVTEDGAETDLDLGHYERFIDEDLDKGGTLRLGSYPCLIQENTKMEECYGADLIYERHRHRYEFNNAYREKLEQAGLRISGTSPEGRLVETVELSDHPFYVGVQFHPEFKSRPNEPHPLFCGFIGAALKQDIRK